ncbi:MAG: D-alanyl-D-alanine carboxypeptidase family protein [Ruminococcaceae bacterium]|nr:D-alanyl-D-alanine carboxypeptidase family protein [Oscillospiraceae bacterium]
MRGKTRRDEIVGEYRREQITAIALIIATVVLVLSMMISCGRSCTCGEEADEPYVPPEGVVVWDKEEAEAIKEWWEEEEKLNAPREAPVLNAEDIGYLRSVTEYPRLINKENPLPTGYEPPELVRLQGMPGGVKQQLNYEAANAFFALRDAMLAEGMSVDPLSGYRTYDEQANIYNYNIDLRIEKGMTPEEARDAVSTRVAMPGYSEHQYGRSIDVTIDGSTDDLFHETAQGQWIAENAHKYGFIIRYLRGATDVTGYDYEPWHLRWVGVEHAEFIHRHNLCLEEYIDLVLQYNPNAVMRYE